MSIGEPTKDSEKIAVCVNCKKPIVLTELPTNTEGNIYSRYGMREYLISGMCEYCFDVATMELEDEAE